MSEGRNDRPPGADGGEAEEATRALFRSIALERQGYYDSKPGGRPRLSVWQRRIRRVIERILDDRMLREPPVRRLLDAGCGRGDLTLELAARYPALEEIWGCDFSEELIDLARSGAAEVTRVRFAVCALHELPFEGAHVDVTVCINVLHHVPSDRLGAALHELARVTRGTLLVEIKNARSPYFRMHSQRVEGVAIFPATVDRVQKLLAPHGFRLVSRRGIFGIVWLSPLVALHFEREGSAEPDPLGR